MKFQSTLQAVFLIFVAGLFLCSCASRRAVVRSNIDVESMIDASKKAVHDIGFKAVSTDKEQSYITGTYDSQNACCSYGTPEGTRIRILVKPASGPSTLSEADIKVQFDQMNIFRDLLMAIQNEVPDARIILKE